MALNYLHNHPDFPELIRIVGEENSMDPALIEKDYWIMHCLFGLQQTGMIFELKGGTSLSKGYGIIHRFSEDIDLRIEPPPEIRVPIGHNQDKPMQCQRRKEFYDWLTKEIKIEGIYDCQRDTIFDDKKYRSGGIRLLYKPLNTPLEGLKTGILLEVGFDDVTPNVPKDMTSWAYEYGASKVSVLDNRPKGVPCYHPGYTLVEKLQTISTKFRKQQKTATFSENFMRHYYDVYCLLQTPAVQSFIETEDYQKHKKKRFRQEDNPVIRENEAFRLGDLTTRLEYKKAYKNSRNLYYKGQPEFDEILNLIQTYINKL
ncbi:MAG TPA: nucleotidyl transferase AbiEii/AbiGii toxin family protein [Alphaproteobacteria bacterium]|nr:nucleotidyl transferase AbiEii/AbiGii toxin family protein [Alphaproteobacteria bacterium]